MTPEASTNKTTGEGSRLECGLVSYRSLASFCSTAGKNLVQEVLLTVTRPAQTAALLDASVQLTDSE